jgi:hypothetical protein
VRLAGAIQLTQFEHSLYCAADDTYVFNAHKRLHKHVVATSNSLAEHLSNIDDAIGMGISVKKSVPSGQIHSILHPMIRRARLAGFRDSQELTGKKLTSEYKDSVERRANKRAAKVDDFMRGTTLSGLKRNPDSPHTLSPARAAAAVRYESAKSYYRGVRDGFDGVDGFGKMWATTSSDPCDECNDNEDEGMVPTDDTFGSGHWAPLLHLNCQCHLHIGAIK